MQVTFCRLGNTLTGGGGGRSLFAPAYIYLSLLNFLAFFETRTTSRNKLSDLGRLRCVKENWRELEGGRVQNSPVLEECCCSWRFTVCLGQRLPWVVIPAYGYPVTPWGKALSLSTITVVAMRLLYRYPSYCCLTRSGINSLRMAVVVRSAPV